MDGHEQWTRRYRAWLASVAARQPGGLTAAEHAAVRRYADDEELPAAQAGEEWPGGWGEIVRAWRA